MNQLVYDLGLLDPPGDSLVGSMRFFFRHSRESPETWDRFAQSTGSTFRGAYQSALAWQLRHHLVFVLRRYDIFAGGPASGKKIGQFALGIGRQTRVFGETLQLLPGYQDDWPMIMQGILDKLGPGRYQYGSDWTTERCRCNDISRLQQASIQSKRAIDVYAVDFSDYSSWDEFYKSISNNVRRNVAVASRVGCNTSLSSPSRLIIENCRLLLMKKAMFGRKGLRLSLLRSLAVLLLRLHSLRKFIFTATTQEATRTMSIFCGLRFGRDLYYLEGASVEKPGGAAWHLLMAMLRLAFENSRGVGKCVLGPDDGSARDQTAWENLRRQRLQCRAKPFATSIVTFSYAPALRRPSFDYRRPTLRQLGLASLVLKR